MEQIETKPGGFAWRVIAAVLAPLAIASAYLFLSRWPTYRFTTASDLAGLGVALLVGLGFVATLRLRWQQRLFCVVIYVFLEWLLLTVYSLQFVGVVFDEWL